MFTDTARAVASGLIVVEVFTDTARAVASEVCSGFVTVKGMDFRGVFCTTWASFHWTGQRARMPQICAGFKVQIWPQELQEQSVSSINFLFVAASAKVTEVYVPTASCPVE